MPDALKPPYDEELAAALAAFPPGDITPEAIPALRKMQEENGTLELAIAGQPFTHQERTVPGPAGPVTLSFFYPQDLRSPNTARPAIYQVHSGGVICGTRFTFINEPLRWAKANGAICITVEYRLAPEHPYPAALDDCWAGLKWVGEHASELGIDPERIIVTGQSAGGGLAAALAIKARDNNGPKIRGQLIDCGMLDDRMTSSSVNQYTADGTWTRGSNVTAWNAILGDKAGKDGVSILAAVNRATPKDLEGLPPALVAVGSAEGFRDENVDYAKKLWAAGVVAELHVWPGGYHCFDQIMPDVPVSKASLEAKAAWVKKMLSEPTAKL